MIIKVNIPIRISGIMLFPFIIINTRWDFYKKRPDALIRHERIHFWQAIEMLVIPFYLWYLVELVFKGYDNISFEKEANDCQYDKDYIKNRKPYSWIKYL